MTHKEKTFNISYQANFISTKKENDLRVWIAKPQSSTYQKVNSFNISSHPTSSYHDNQGNEILYFHFKKIEDIDLNLTINVALSVDSKDKTYKISRQNMSKKSLFIRDDKFLEQTSAIKDLVHKITKSKPTMEDKIKSIFDFIFKEFEYCYPVKKRGVKNLNLKKLRGDCGEYSGLLVTMLRVLGVPAVNQTGFVIFPKDKSIVEHGWASILSGNNRLDIDPQYASLESSKTNAYKKYFIKRSEYRLVFTTGFNIPLKPKIPPAYDKKFWNDLGLPLSSSSVQTLQPLVFASKYKIKFKDVIKFE